MDAIHAYYPLILYCSISILGLLPFLVHLNFQVQIVELYLYIFSIVDPDYYHYHI